MYNDPRRSVRQFFFKGGIPFTITLMTVNVITWFMNAIMQRSGPALYLGFNSGTWPVPYLWTVLTWPLVGYGHPISLLLSLAWAYWVCGSLERSWGTRPFATFFFALAGLTAVTTWLGGALLKLPVGLFGLWDAMAAPTVAWCILNAREKVGLYFGLVQIPALWLAWLSAIVLWYEVGVPLLGLFALSGCLAAWWYVTQGRQRLSRLEESRRIHDAAARFKPGPPESTRPGEGFNPLRWWKDRQERKRLEDIFRRSGFTDDDK